jgi:tetratricopeptide (TPR) repeat protein
MLNTFSKKREQKTTARAIDHFDKAIKSLNGKLFKQAMIEFNNALKLDVETIGLKLEKEFKNYHDAGEMEAAFSMGGVLFKVKNKDHQFANQLGNCARKQGNYKSANNFYRHALKINKRFEIAFYNLAASMGKVDRYDEDIKIVLQEIYKTDYFVLPEYAGNKEIIKIIDTALIHKNEKEKADRLKNMQLEKDELELRHEFVKAKKLGHNMKLLEEKADTPDTEEVFQYFLENIREQKSLDTPEANKALHENQYNLAIYALKKGNGEMAIRVLTELKETRNLFEYTDMLRAIAYSLIQEKDKTINIFVKLLGENQNNRYYNVNLGIYYRRTGNRLLAAKYLLIGAVLLEKSDGLYHVSDLIRIANEHHQNGAYKKALKLYHVIISEDENLDVYFSIGEVYITLEHYDKAMEIYFKILEIDKTSEKAKVQLRKIHDHFSQKAGEFFERSIFKQAVKNYELALRAQRLSKTIKRTADIYKFLKDNELPRRKRRGIL